MFLNVGWPASRLLHDHANLRSGMADIGMRIRDLNDVGSNAVKVLSVSHGQKMSLVVAPRGAVENHASPQILL